jgi:hypothetical protein
MEIKEKCEFCLTFEFKSKLSFSAHCRQCIKNPNRTPSKLGHKGGNHFTTGRSTGHSIETRLKFSEIRKNSVCSQETKDKISKSRIKYLDENPDKVPYVLNHSSKQSYPEKYFKDVFGKDEGVQFEFRVSRYSLDIAFPLTKFNIEIDGEQHYNDARVIASDIRRNQFLKDLGWVTFRIRWSEYKRLNQQKREDFIKDLRKSVLYSTVSIIGTATHC